MQQVIENISIEPAWFKTWFDSDYYHKLYSHRDEQEACSFIDALLNELQPASGCSVLDLGCGAGRHSKYLAQKGFRVTGLDISPGSIREAKKSETALLQFGEHDMRMPFGKNRFSLVFNFFTSFGYFSDARENEQVVKNIAGALKKDGLVLFDYLNTVYAEENLIAVEEKEIDGVIYHINRWADDHSIYKRISIQDNKSLGPLEYTERVAKFGVADFNRFFSSCNLQTVNVYGNYGLDEYNENRSKRLIILAKKLS